MRFKKAIEQWRSTWRHLLPVRRLLFFVVFSLMIVSAFAEMISIASVLPFISAITSPEVLLKHQNLGPFLERFGVTSSAGLVLFATIVFCCAAVVAGVIRLSVIWFEERLSVRIGSDFGRQMFQNVLHRPYLDHCSQNSSEVISGVTNKLTSLTVFVRTAMSMLRSFLIILVVTGGLLLIEPIIVLGSLGAITMVYVLVVMFFKKQIKRVSRVTAVEAPRVVEAIQSGLGGIRDIILDGSHHVFVNAFDRANVTLRRAQASSVVMANAPYFVIQAFGIVAIAIFAFHITQSANSEIDPFAFLGMIALAAARLFPVAQDVYRASIGIAASQNSIDDALLMLGRTPESRDRVMNAQPIRFQKQISLKKVSFSYRDDLPAVFTDVSLVIEKGSRVGFIGETGCGKSTLLDVIMGLVPPTGGGVEVDGLPLARSNVHGWYEHIAHVPQAIYLANDTIERNVAFGAQPGEIDYDRLGRAVEAAQLSETVNSLKDGLRTIVGENGVRLSGGQRQRLGIARALYKKADLMVLDEATSALDNETESRVMNAIEDLDSSITVLIVAHRLTTLKNCSSIIELTQSGINRLSYHELIQRDSSESPNRQKAQIKKP